MSASFHLQPQHAAILLDKMNERNLLEAIVTTNGEELVTPIRVKIDIQEAVHDRAGRASLTQLQADAGVDEATIDTAMRQLCNENSAIHRIEFGGVKELLTEAYLDSLALEAGEVATRRGRVTLSELSSTFKLPIDFMKVVIQTRMADPAKHGLNASKIEYGALVTDVYLLKTKAEIRDVCGAATQPCPVEEIMKACNLCPEAADMAVDVLQDLIQSGELEGSLTGGRLREYVPKSFLAMQRKKVEAFFLANGYLDNSTAHKMQVCKFQSFVKESFPTAEFLDAAVVSRGVMEQLEAIADEAVAQGSWFEAWSVVPTVLSDADAARLVGLCTACKRTAEDPLRAIQLAKVYGASAKFVADLVDGYCADCLSKIHESRATEAANDDNEDTLSGRIPSRKNGGKSRTRKRGSKLNNEDELVSTEEVCSFFSSHVPELQDHPSFVSALGEYLLPRFRDAKRQAIRRFQDQPSQVDVCEQPGNFETVFERKYSSFQLFCRGVAALRHALRNRVEIEGTPNAVDMSKEGVLVRKRNCSASLNAEDAKRQAEIYLLRTRGAELANLITESECSKLDILFASQDSSRGHGSERKPIITMEASAALMEVLPPDVGKALSGLWRSAMTGTELSVFCDILEGQVLPSCNLVGRRVGKRKERQLLADSQQRLKETLFKSVSEQEVLHVGVLLVFQKVTGALPLLPHPRSGSTASPLEPANGQEPEKSCEMEKAWPLILLEAIRGETPSEAERALWNLQLDIEGSESVSNVQDQKTASGNIGVIERQNSTDQDPQSHAATKDSAWRLLRSTEIARSAALACGE